MGFFVRLDVRRLTVSALLALTCALLFVGLTDMGLCMPALHAALTLATALGTWWLARDDFALNGSGAVGRLVLTGVCLGLGLTWAGATVAALLAVAAGEPWTHGEFAQVLRHFMDDAAWHWTPLGLVAAFVGTALSIILDEIGGSSAGRDERA